MAKNPQSRSGLPWPLTPGGVAACSRWWSVVCDTTGKGPKESGPRQGSKLFHQRAGTPSGCVSIFMASGGVANNAPPPATSYDPSGISSRLQFFKVAHYSQSGNGCQGEQANQTWRHEAWDIQQGGEKERGHPPICVTSFSLWTFAMCRTILDVREKIHRHRVL